MARQFFNYHARPEDGLRRSLLFGEFSSLKLIVLNALSSLSFNLNAMTICKRNDDARARTGSATQSNAFTCGKAVFKTEHRNASPYKGKKDEAEM
jgi:hypothetical protein